MAQMRQGGGYRQSASFQTATIVYDATCRLCDDFPDLVKRLAEQMVLVARSARLSIAAGCLSAATSPRTELRQLNAARSGFEKLLLDFEDFLRQRRLAQWAADSAESLAIEQAPRKYGQGLADQPEPIDLSGLTDHERWALYAPWLEHDDPAVRANALICLVLQTGLLLDRQIAALDAGLPRQVDARGKNSVARPAERVRGKSAFEPEDRSDYSDQPDDSDDAHDHDRPSRTDQREQPDKAGDRPNCPSCGKPMVLRTAKTGKNSGSNFWGCSAYPKCKGTMNV